MRGGLEEQRAQVRQDERGIEQPNAVHVAHLAPSVEQEHLEDVPEEPAPRAVREAELRHRLIEVGEQRLQLGLAARGGEAPVARGRVEDRKSTRLNSSHGYISYAVFCLKKKKQ